MHHPSNTLLSNTTSSTQAYMSLNSIFFHFLYFKPHEEVKEYIKNIDFELVDDYMLLDNVYSEIKGSEEQLILDFDIADNIMQLVSKSSVSQILNLIRKINLVGVINKKNGARVFETIFVTLGGLLKNNEIKKDLLKRVFVELVDPIYQDLETILVNRHGTFALRKYFEFVCGNKNLCDKVDLKSKLMTMLETNLEIEQIITISTYLKISYSKRVARKFVERFLSIENLGSPLFSYAFEDLIAIGDKKTLESISKFVEDNFGQLVDQKYANYVVSRLIQRLPERVEVYYACLDLKNTKTNSNILLRIFEGFCKQGNADKIDQILREFYQIEESKSVFYELLLSETTGINTKFVDAVCHLMDLEEDLYNVNADMSEYFDESWLNKKCGIKLVKAFLEGGSSIKLKKRLIAKLKLTSRLLKKEDGVKIQNLVRTLKKARV